MNAFRLLPSIDLLLARPRVEELCARVGRERMRAELEGALETLRAEIKAGMTAEALAAGRVEELVEASLRADARQGLVRAINATGVVLHTGLGRAPVHPEAAEAMRVAAQSYCVLEVERTSGARGQRDARLSQLLARLTGAEAGLAVNNNAAACLLTIAALSHGRETIVSRGELVEIGGSFRVPDVMASAGVTLVEVGATNRTRAADYERAITAATGLLMKVHSSNFRLVGFTEEVPMADLADLGRARGVATAFDLGSGRLEADGARPLDMLGGETLVRDAVASGLEVVSFSGDKLLGGPQAGLIVGTAERVAALRKNPIYRAMRLDKTALAGLEATVQLLLDGRGDEVPTRRMLLMSADEVRSAADDLAAALPGVSAEVRPSESEPGSGAAPGEYLPSFVVRVEKDGWTPERLAAALRASDPPVFARIQDGALLLDPRTLLPGDRDDLVRVFDSLQ